MTPVAQREERVLLAVVAWLCSRPVRLSILVSRDITTINVQPSRASELNLQLLIFKIHLGNKYITLHKKTKGEYIKILPGFFSSNFFFLFFLFHIFCNEQISPL